MTYMIILQDSNVLGTCFGELKYWVHDGPMSIGSINSQGKIQEIVRGDLINGKFKERENV